MQICRRPNTKNKTDIRNTGKDKIIKGEIIMSKADEMFEELRYEIDSTYEIKGHLYYCKDNIKIDFDLKRQNFYKYSTTGCRCPITMQELQAINEKIKELGWNE